MFRKAIIVVLTVAASMTALTWFSSYRQKPWQVRYGSYPGGTPWRMSWGEDAGSLFLLFGESMESVYLTTDDGAFAFCYARNVDEIPNSRGFDWRILSYQYGSRYNIRYHQVRSTFAVPFVMLLTYPAGSLVRGPLRRYRRRRRGLCLRCAYNLEGNVSGTCSECGTAVKNPPSSGYARHSNPASECDPDTHQQYQHHDD